LIEAEVVLETVRRQGLNQVVVSHDGHDAMNVLYVLSSTVCIYVLFMQ
jgi:predicted Fe-Mo cluster-binding NifX family protein